MKILITGATGLIGKELGKYLSAQGHELYVVSRSQKKARQELPFQAQIIEHDLGKSPLGLEKLKDIEAVFHLAGENVADRRWNKKVKDDILESRVVGTENLVKSLSANTKVLISSSAIGFYGSRRDEELTESSPAGEGFLAEVCLKWEKAADSFGGRKVFVRTGIVLASQGGALDKMLFPFRAGVGGALGDGKSWMSWIHIEDMVRLLVFALEDSRISGPLNAVSPTAVTNLEFSKTLAKSLKRPLGPAVPALALKLLFGEMSEVLLGSQKVLPEKALKAGFEFKYRDLDKVFAEVLKPFLQGEEIFYAEQFLPLKPEEIFPFFSEAKNLEEITPDILSFHVKKVSTPRIQQGTLIDYTLKIHGVPASWKTEIDEWHPPFKFVDNQLRGPYKMWHHTHEFKVVPGGTLMTDRVRYRLPMGFIGWLTAWHFVRKDVRAIFAYRKQKVTSLFYK